MKFDNKFSKVNIYCVLVFLGVLPYWWLKSRYGAIYFVGIYVLYALVIRLVAERFGKEE